MKFHFYGAFCFGCLSSENADEDHTDWLNNIGRTESGQHECVRLSLIIFIVAAYGSLIRNTELSERRRWRRSEGQGVLIGFFPEVKAWKWGTVRYAIPRLGWGEWIKWVKSSDQVKGWNWGGEGKEGKEKFWTSYREIRLKFFFCGEGVMFRIFFNSYMSVGPTRRWWRYYW